MKKLLLLSVIFLWKTSSAQQTINRDPEIEQMIREVSPDSLISYIKTLVSFGTRNTLSSTTDPKRGIGAARNWVLSRFNEIAKTSQGRLTAFIDTTTLQPDGKRVDVAVNLGNVVATLKGVDPNDNRVFVISGHLDNMRSSVMDRTGDAPGANDDASGVAALIECARIMSKHRFPATVVFVAVSGEEQGLLGSNFMSEKAKKEGMNVEAVLNNDIMGSNNSNETNIINNTQVRIFSEGLPAFETEKNAVQIRNLGLENDGKSRQHQDVRTENGIAYGDLLEHIDAEYLRKNTALNLCNLASLAKAAAMPDSVKMDVKKLSNSTYLYWKAPRVGAVKGYYVLIRETTSAFWQRKFFTTATEMRLPYSKDNYFFAVQAVNESENESLMVVPGVGR